MCFESENQNENNNVKAEQTTTDKKAGASKKTEVKADLDSMAIVAGILGDINSGKLKTGKDLSNAMKERLTEEQIFTIAINTVLKMHVMSESVKRRGAENPIEGLLEALKRASESETVQPKAEAKTEPKAESQDTAEDDCNCGDYVSPEVAEAFAEKMATIAERAATDDAIQTKGDIKRLVIESNLTPEELAIAATELVHDRLADMNPLELMLHGMKRRG